MNLRVGRNGADGPRGVIPFRVCPSRDVFTATIYAGVRELGSHGRRELGLWHSWSSCAPGLAGGRSASLVPSINGLTSTSNPAVSCTHIAFHRVTLRIAHRPFADSLWQKIMYYYLPVSYCCFYRPLLGEVSACRRLTGRARMDGGIGSRRIAGRDVSFS